MIIIGSATGPNKIVIDAALDHLSQASAQNQILLIRVKPINRDASGVCALLGIRTVNANEAAMIPLLYTVIVPSGC